MMMMTDGVMNDGAESWNSAQCLPPALGQKVEGQAWWPNQTKPLKSEIESESTKKERPFSSAAAVLRCFVETNIFSQI